jgi:hypothetical protein
METQQSVFGGHTRGDHAGLQPRGEGTKYTWLEAASGPRLRLILGSGDIGMQRRRTRLVAWGMFSAHLMYLERLAAEMQYAWVLVMRPYVLFRATFVISKSH